MAVEVVVRTDDVKRLREELDRMSIDPPTVGTNEKVPDTTFLTYYSVDSEPLFMAIAMQYGACSARKAG